MYDMYPEWGPAKNRRDEHADRPDRAAHGFESMRTERRDEHGERPDDN